MKKQSYLPPTHCHYCDRSVGQNHFFWMKDDRYTAGGKWRCRQRKRDSDARRRERIKKDPDALERQRSYHREYHKRNPEVARYKSMVAIDKKKGWDDTDINLDAYREMVSKPCYYCGVSGSGGLDRINNNLPHRWGNVVPCCEKCNIILGDLPFEAKEILKAGLHEIRRSSLLEDWTIPTKRRRLDV